MEDSCISLYRDKLDKTLSCHDLTDVETLGRLVKDQILRSSEVENEDFINNIAETRTKEVSHFLGMLSSASVDDVERSKYSEASHRGWKVKQDTEEFRVMYREGPEGTPFHTLLVEGYVDGPLDVCLCIAWVAGLYPKWWPQITVPSFKLISSQCLQKVRIGEQICLVRMKFSWPLSTREAIIHYFEFEYLRDDLVVVLLNSISDLESIDISSHGFTRDGIPDAQDVIRIDVVGGFALQKVSANRSYLRKIANMDVKLDFVPPALINFVSRKILGSGFMLYKKKVASVAKDDEDFSKALKDPLYAHVGQFFYSNGLSTKTPQPAEMNNDTSCLLKEQLEERENVSSSQEMVHNHDSAVNSQAGDSFVQDKKLYGEIEEIKENDSEGSQCLAELDNNSSINLPTNQIHSGFSTDNKKVVIHPEVEQALRILDDVISVFQECRPNHETRILPGSPKEELQYLENNKSREAGYSEANRICKNTEVRGQPTEKEDPEAIGSYEPRNSSSSHRIRHTGSSTYCRNANHNKIAPASQDFSGPCEIDHAVSLSSQNQRTELTLTEKATNDENVFSPDANGVGGDEARRSKNRKIRFCCFSSLSWQYQLEN
ncbi:uncharacterized protein [Coffea arabica]|uniref:Uncharacterized protein LOC113743406 isoform X1 n=1 Tax=Coffea arabica TaxID=13443 RepID=A0A6P6XHF7_COFAR|nr:uncharacterized protein LOC113743406 isoform X1 [Coffea arabica]XP_027127198.1 uncharacterized protein LOC113743406 isoform X1 [Coffea arabica]